MRPGQNGQNKRMRGRPQNNRRGPNPLTRSYESNGPDVKVRGNAHHIAEKYLQLARDAHTSGDPVAAENYLQHAEHYFRLIAAAQAAQAAALRPPGEVEVEDMDDDDDGGVLDRFASPAERAPPYAPPPQPFAPPPQPQQPSQPQPQQSGGYGYNNDRQPYEGDRNNGGERNYQPRNDRPQYNRDNRQENRQDNRPPRPPFNERNEGQRNEGPRNDGNRDHRDNRPPREFRPYREPQPPREPQPDLSEQPATALPAFITAAPRVATEILEAPQPVIEPTPAPPAASAEAPSPAPEEAAVVPRGRRRRLRSPYGFNAGDEAPAPAAPAEVPPTD